MNLTGFESSVKDILVAHAPLLAVLTGGIDELRDTPVSGNSFQKIVSSKRDPTQGNIIKPFGMVRGRNIVATPYNLRDEPTQYTSAEQTVEVWIMDDATSSKTAMNAATALVYALLQYRPPTGAFQCELVHYGDLRDYDFSGARAMLLEFLITFSISAS